MTDNAPDDALEELVNMLLESSQRHRISLEEAQRKAARLRIPEGDIQAAADIIRAEQQRNIQPAVSVTSARTRSGAWYYGPRNLENSQWVKYRQKWIDSGKPGLDYLEESTTNITALLADPRGTETRKGLVMGNVQSGKTGNFAGVIAKAVDEGYRVIIVMAGLYNNLRAQTQTRLVHDVFGYEWQLRTQDDADLGPVKEPARDFRTSDMTALVIKKNTTRLENLRDALSRLPEEHRRNLPVLIIDDEADQATPNSPTRKRAISPTNQLMRDIWKEVRVGTYLAYTATPFANVLMDPDEDEELFPSDFITSLRPGSTYFGAERVFGIADGVEDGEQKYTEGLNMVRQVPDAEVDELRPPSNSEEREEYTATIVDSLAEAVRWFLIATALRRLRNDHGHSSMLVHTTHYAGPHFAMKEALDDWLETEAATADWSRLEQLWIKEKDCVREGGRHQPAWEEIAARIPDVLEELRVIVDNGSSADRLDYTEKEQTVIAIGGGTLSRGLTLEGLVVSYFTRSTNTYDTLMQMGRWFGYRDGYEDLPRIWVSKGLDKDYAFLARVEKDLRDEIESFQGTELTPKQLGVKVRFHPGRLEITSVGRMKNASVVRVSLSETMRQSFILDGSRETYERNLSAVERLLGDGAAYDRQERIEARGLSSERVIDFLQNFTSHPDQTILQSTEQLSAMTEWLQTFGKKASWTALVVNNSQSPASAVLRKTSIAGMDVVMTNRSVMKGSTEKTLNFKAVFNPSDWLADIDPTLLAGRSVGRTSDKIRARRELAPSNGLVVIYPISPASRANSSSQERMDLAETGVDHPVLAFAIIFPSIGDHDGREATYVSVRPNPNAIVDEVDMAEEIADSEKDATPND